MTINRVGKMFEGRSEGVFKSRSIFSWGRVLRYGIYEKRGFKNGSDLVQKLGYRRA